jgi:hypothetical protein
MLLQKLAVARRLADASFLMLFIHDTTFLYPILATTVLQGETLSSSRGSSSYFIDLWSPEAENHGSNLLFPSHTDFLDAWLSYKTCFGSVPPKL